DLLLRLMPAGGVEDTVVLGRARAADEEKGGARRRTVCVLPIREERVDHPIDAVGVRVVVEAEHHELWHLARLEPRRRIAPRAEVVGRVRKTRGRPSAVVPRAGIVSAAVVAVVAAIDTVVVVVSNMSPARVFRPFAAVLDGFSRIAMARPAI